VAGWKSSLNLGADAEVTGGGVLTDVSRHLWPPVIPAHQLQSLPPSGVSSDLTVMVQGHCKGTVGSEADNSSETEGVRLELLLSL